MTIHRTVGGVLVSASILLLAAAAASCGGEKAKESAPLGAVRSGLTVHPATKRIRIAHWNTFARPSTGSVWGKSEGSALSLEDHAKSLAATLRSHADQFDVLVLNEVFSDVSREAIYNELKSDFPNWVKEIDGPMNFLAGKNLSDSGLALFSRYPFGLLTDEPDSAYYEADTSDPRAFYGACRPNHPKNRAPTPEELDSGIPVKIECNWSSTLAFEYTVNKNDDGKAAKGWALANILGPGRPLNIGFTHLQADYWEDGDFYPGTRQAQLPVIKELMARRMRSDVDADTILVGDMNIDGLASNFREPLAPATAASPNQKMIDSEYGKSIRTNVAGLPFYDIWRTTSPEDDGQTHRFFGPPARYDYFLINGAGYYDSVNPWSPLAPRFLSNYGHGYTCPQYLRRAFQEGPSDHIGLILDLGPWSSACRPDMAIHPERDPSWSQLRQAIQPDTLPEPGAVMWYRVDEPGTYSVGFPTGSDAAARLRVEMYPVNDLSFVVQPIARNPAARVPGLHDDFDTVSLFSGTQPFYLRVFDPEGLTSGSYRLLIKQHDCSSVEWECPLKPAVEKRVDAPPGQPFVGNFRIKTYSTETTREQRGRIEVKNPSGQELRVTVTNTRTGASQVESFRDRLWETRFSERDANVYRVTVERSNSFESYSITYRTDLTLLASGPDPSYGSSLTLLKETAGWGNDEIRAVLKNEMGKVKREWFWPEMDSNEGMPLVVTMPFLSTVSFYVAELGAEEYSPIDPNSVDESAVVYISPLAPNKEKEVGVEREFQLCELPPNEAECQGKLRLRYNLVHSLDP